MRIWNSEGVEGGFFVGGPPPFSFPAGTDLLFFVLPKKSKQKKG
ncbi:hypothetical protein SAMN03159417_04733, partial [Ralstonia sp. NFACC01]